MSDDLGAKKCDRCGEIFFSHHKCDPALLMVNQAERLNDNLAEFNASFRRLVEIAESQNDAM